MKDGKLIFTDEDCENMCYENLSVALKETTLKTYSQSAIKGHILKWDNCLKKLRNVDESCNTSKMELLKMFFAQSREFDNVNDCRHCGRLHSALNDDKNRKIIISFIEQELEDTRTFYETSKARLAIEHKEHYTKHQTTKHKCPCGGIYSNRNRAIHISRPKHTNFVKIQNDAALLLSISLLS